MTGNPKEYRRHAARCAELAASARPQQLKTALLELSKNWERLAIDLEIGVVMFDDVEVVTEVRQPLDNKQLSENLVTVASAAILPAPTNKRTPRS